MQPAAFSQRTALAALSAAALTLGACASVPADAGFSTVADEARARIGVQPVWPRTPEAKAEIERRVEAALTGEVTADEAVQVALLNNRNLRAELEDLSVARADFLEAVQPPNPLLEAVRLDPENDEPTVLDFSVTAPLLRLINLPRSSRAGAAAFDAARAGATAAVVALAGHTRVAYSEYLAAKQRLDLFQQAYDTARVGLAAREALYEAGNIAKVDLDRERAFVAEIVAQRMGAEAAVAPRREALNKLMGLSGPPAAAWEAVPRLDHPPEEPLDTAAVEARAVSESLAIQESEARLRALAARRGITDLASILPDLELIGAAEREDGVWKRGGGVALELPIFGFGGAGRLRADAALRQAAERRAALEVEVRADARALAVTAEALRRKALYRRETALPAAIEVLRGVQLDFNAMQVGVFELLQARRDQFRAGRDYIDAQRDFWVARARLDSLLAGRRPDGATGETEGARGEAGASSGQEH